MGHPFPLTDFLNAKALLTGKMLQSLEEEIGVLQQPYSRGENQEEMYYQIKDIERTMVYSAKEFQEILRREFLGKKLQKIFAHIDGQKNFTQKEENKLDFYMMGGAIVLVFQTKVMQVVVHAEGLIEYGIVPIEQIQIKEIPQPTEAELWNEGAYYDLSDEFLIEYEKQSVKNIFVKRINTYPFTLKDFDEERGDKAAENWDMPAGLSFIFENGNSFQIVGDDIEYYFLRMQSLDDREREQALFQKALACNPPDYDAANKILWSGLDINVPIARDDEENLLSEMFLGFGWSEDENKETQKVKTAHLVNVIKYMLEYGLDLSNDGGGYGAMCLSNLTFSTHDENIVYAAKLLLDNGAKNIQFEDGETPLSTIGGEASYLSCGEQDAHVKNIFDTLYEIVEQADEGKNYHNIEVYFEAKGKTIQRVLKGKDERGIFAINYETSTHKNCFVSKIYFDLGELFLAVDKRAGLICYKKLEEETEDASHLFKDYIGRTIKEFEFDYNKLQKGKTYWGQTVAEIVLENDASIVFTDNYGEHEEESVGYFILNDKRWLTKVEKDLIKLMANMGFEQQYVLGAFAGLKSNYDREKLLRYLLFKGEFATASDSLNYCDTIERANGKRYQYLPGNLFVRYVGEAIDELTQGDDYQVHTVYGVKTVVYYLMNDKEEMREYPAENFIRVRPSLVIYTGIPDENGGETEIAEGFELNEEYSVIDERGMNYVLADGRTVPFYETEEIELVPAESKKLKPINHEILLQMLSYVLEFGDTHRIYERMTDNTNYYSEARDLTLIGREKIFDHIEAVAKYRVEENGFSDVVLATVTEDDDKRHKKGERFLMLFHEDGTRSSAFIYDDGMYITKIDLLQSWPAYQLDKRKINRLSKNS